MFWHWLIQSMVLYGAGLAFTLALGQAVDWRHRRNRVLFLLLLCIGIWQTGFAFFYIGLENLIPHLLFWVLLSVLLSGPLIELFFAYLSAGDENIPNRFFLRFLPSCVFVGYYWISLLIQVDSNPKYSLSGIFENENVFRSIFLGANIIYTGYILIALRSTILLAREDHQGDFKARHTIGILVLSLLCASTGSLSMLFSSMVLSKITSVEISIILLLNYLISRKYPQLLDGFVLQRKKQEQRHLLRINLDQLGKRLTKLMEEENVYCDEDLNLQSLASMLSVTPHQLSQYLNERLHITFRKFVNDFRIRAAEEMLLEVRHRSILEVGLAVGFNSNSVFYEAFKERTGKSPAQYRRDTNVR